jgi:prevent-host-death family protein
MFPYDVHMHLAEDIIPLGEFKTGIFSCLKKNQATGRPLIITRNGRPAGELLSPAEYDNLVYRRQFIESVEQGLAEAESGAVYSTEEIRKMFVEKRVSEKQ